MTKRERMPTEEQDRIEAAVAAHLGYARVSSYINNYGGLDVFREDHHWVAYATREDARKHLFAELRKELEEWDTFPDRDGLAQHRAECIEHDHGIGHILAYDGKEVGILDEHGSVLALVYQVY